MRCCCSWATASPRSREGRAFISFGSKRTTTTATTNTTVNTDVQNYIDSNVNVDLTTAPTINTAINVDTQPIDRLAEAVGSFGRSVGEAQEAQAAQLSGAVDRLANTATAIADKLTEGNEGANLARLISTYGGAILVGFAVWAAISKGRIADVEIGV